MAEATILTSRGWNTKERFMMEGAGDEGLSMIEKATLCLMESG